GLLPSVVGVPPGARELSVPVSPSGFTMETSGSLRFLGNPGGHCPCSSTPAGSGRLSGPRVSCLTRPPPVSTTKAPSVLYFRGSITRPLTSLSTLRRMGRPTTTQDSLLAAGPALPGGIRTRRVSAKGFLAPASWCAGSAIKRPCEPVPVTHAPEGHRPDAKRRVHRCAARLPARPRPAPLVATNSSPGVCSVPTPPSHCISPPVCWR